MGTKKIIFLENNFLRNLKGFWIVFANKLAKINKRIYAKFQSLKSIG